MRFLKVIISTAVLGAAAILCPSISLHGLVGDKPSKFFVRFIATSTIVHSAWSGNQDVYLAELRAKSGGASFLAKLVDEYPGYGNPISHDLLVSGATSLVKMNRDPACDVRYVDMPLRAAAGDRITGYPAPTIFVPRLSSRVSEDLIVQCFRLVHR